MAREAQGGSMRRITALAFSTGADCAAAVPSSEIENTVCFQKPIQGSVLALRGYTLIGEVFVDAFVSMMVSALRANRRWPLFSLMGPPQVL